MRETTTAPPLVSISHVSGAPAAAQGPGMPGGPGPRSGAGGAHHGRVPAVTGARTHRSYLELAAAPEAVPYARRYTRHTLAAWTLSMVADDAEVVVSEMVTNAVRATLEMRRAAPVALYIAADHDRLALLVWDACPQPPVHRPHDDDAVGGRGLEIIEALSDRYGSCLPDDGGKVVWAWFDLPRD
jgi:anti-sigma regulatory factor (Ser/Thr protein kinase)